MIKVIIFDWFGVWTEEFTKRIGREFRKN